MSSSARAMVFGIVLLVLAGGSTLLHAQNDEGRATVRTSRPPHFAGVPISIQVTVEGFDEEPDPVGECPPPEKGALTYLGSGPVAQQTFIFNGNMTRSVTHSVQYRFVADKAGRYKVGPFTVRQGSQTVTARAVEFNVSEIPLSNDMKLRVLLPEKEIYVGQRVPVTVEWWILESARESILAARNWFLAIPLFDLSAAFQFEDQKPDRGDQAIMFETASGEVTIPVETRNEESNGKTYFVISASRTMVPLKPGDYPLPAAVVTADKVTRWERGFMGGKAAAATTKIRCEDLPRKVVVTDVPFAGRPSSFGGAIGRGFTLEVSADRTVVKVGDPITLSLTLRGEGSLSTAGIASLDRCGLSNDDFRAPSSEITGVLNEDGSKTFTASVRVKRESVRELPPIEYSWFDSESGEYATTRSRPIALSVRASEMATANDAVGGAANTANAGTAGSGPLANEREGAASAALVPSAGVARPTFTLSGADLSNTLGSAVLVSEDDRFGGKAVRYVLFTTPIAFLGAAFAIRRRREIDPAVIARRKALRAAEGRIAAAAGQPERAACEAIAAALRAMLVEVPAARTAEVEKLISECEVILYAPRKTSEPPIDAGLARRAQEMARVIGEGAE